jgi:hypothetical protein
VSARVPRAGGGKRTAHEMRAGSPAETGADMLLRAASAEDDAAALPEHLLRGASRPVPDAGPSKKYKPPVSGAAGTPPR